MLTLIVCIITHILLAVVFKLFVRFKVQSFVAIVVNYWVCMLLGSIMVGHLPIATYDFDTSWVPYGIVLGVVFVTGFNIAALSVLHAGITVTTVMQKMSLLLSAGFAIVFFDELLGIPKGAGLALAIAAIVMINSRGDGGVKISGGGKALTYPVLILIFSGIIEIILYYVHATGLSHDADAELTTFAFSVAGLIGAVVLIWMYSSKRIVYQFKDVIGGIALGLPNFFSIYLILELLGHGFEGSVLFPILNVSVMLGAALVGVLIFKERFKLINIVGLAAAIAAIALISYG